MSNRVILGMSGGVDSSVSALILKEQGYDVVGIFMKNWEEKDENGVCTSEADYSDARAVADQIGIPMYTVNFAKEYWDNVFSYFLSEYKQGRTPNPDVLCNQEIKFKAFLDYALTLDADYIAMGHYARVAEKDGKYYLKRGVDGNKDQTYFLSRISQYALSKSIFPIGDLTKVQVRQIAVDNNLDTALKKDSTGVCFIGERDFNKFLDNYMLSQKGDIIDIDSGAKLGVHTGLIHYTLGQRKGMGIGGIKGVEGDAYFACEKDLKNNILYVAKGENNPKLYSDYLIAKDPSWLTEIPKFPIKCTAKFRYRQADIPVTAELLSDGNLKIVYDNKVKAVTPGQVAVLYDGEICLGGAFIDQVCNFYK